MPSSLHFNRIAAIRFSRQMRLLLEQRRARTQPRAQPRNKHRRIHHNTHSRNRASTLRPVQLRTRLPILNQPFEGKIASRAGARELRAPRAFRPGQSSPLKPPAKPAPRISGNSPRLILQDGIAYEMRCAPPEAWQTWIWGTMPVLAA